MDLDNREVEDNQENVKKIPAVSLSISQLQYFTSLFCLVCYKVIWPRVFNELLQCLDL